MDRFVMFLVILASALLAGGCASMVPESIRTAPADNPNFVDAQRNSDDFVARRVRWGGTIAAVTNKQSETWLEVVERDLRKGGEPLDTDASAGRFIARIQGFLDPAIFESGRRITVAGVLEKAVVQPIGEFTYLYPVVNVDSYYLWEKVEEPVAVEPPPYWYYDPWYPYPHPWYRHPYWPYRPYW